MIAITVCDLLTRAVVYENECNMSVIKNDLSKLAVDDLCEFQFKDVVYWGACADVVHLDSMDDGVFNPNLFSYRLMWLSPDAYFGDDVMISPIYDKHIQKSAIFTLTYDGSAFVRSNDLNSGEIAILVGGITIRNDVTPNLSGMSSTYYLIYFRGGFYYTNDFFRDYWFCNARGSSGNLTSRYALNYVDFGSRSVEFCEWSMARSTMGIFNASANCKF